LRRPAPHYQQRWLFLSATVMALTTRLRPDSAAASPRMWYWGGRKNGTAAGYTLTWSGKEWELSRPVRDHVDPDRLKTILEAVPDVWAERFVDSRAKKLDEYGLKTP